MKKLFQVMAAASLIIITLTACKHQAKEDEVMQNASEETKNDKITKNIYTDEFGEQLEVTINETNNTAVVHMAGKSYELTKSEELPEYTAANAEYQFSDVRGDINFLKKNYNMVLFHHKKANSKSANTKMASY